jgi:4-amino-4-deoxy-L-arabinose transferase-like glycosyltransferase
LLAAAAVLSFIVLGVAALGAGRRDWDEGVYWQSLRALGRGEPLFNGVVATEPPAFYYGLLPFYLVGHGIAAIRLGVLVYGCLGLVAAYFAGRFLAGHRAGLLTVVLLATAPFYVDQSISLQADGPSAALALVAVALSLGARQAGESGQRSRVYLLTGLSGLALALATGTKLSGIVAGVPILLALLASQGRRGRFLAFLAGGFTGLMVLLIPAAGGLSSMWAQLIDSHLAAGRAIHRPLGTNLPVILIARNLPLLGLGAAGIALALWRRDSRILLPLTWTAVTLAAVLVYQPLFRHHLVQLAGPLSLSAAVGLVAQRSRRETPRGETFRAVGSVLSAATAAAVLLAVAGYGLSVGIRHTIGARSAGGSDIQLAAYLRQATRPGEFLISDDQFAVALADRDVPGTMVDTSRQLIADGLLRLSGVEAAAERYRVQHILLGSEPRLVQLPGFKQWLQANFDELNRLPGGTLYARRQG